MPTTIYIILGAGALFFLLSVLAIIDIARREWSEGYMQALWIVVVSMVPFLGCLLYFALGRSRGTPKKQME